MSFPKGLITTQKIIVIKKKIPSVTGLVTTAALNGKMTETENKILDITNLYTKAALNAKVTEVESKIPGITQLRTRTDLNTRHTEIENQITYTTGFITTPEFYILTETSFDGRMKQEAKSLANVQQTLLLSIADKNREKIKRLQTFDLICFNGGRYFGDIDPQNYITYNKFISTNF